MAATVPFARLVPDGENDPIIVSKKGLAELKREAERPARDNERRRKENAELRRRLQVHENPNVPPSVRNHAPGYARDRPLVPPEKRRKPGARPGHEGTTRPPLSPDAEAPLTTDRCTKCHGRQLKFRGTETQEEVEGVPPRKVTNYEVNVYDCLDCGETVRAPLAMAGPTCW